MRARDTAYPRFRGAAVLHRAGRTLHRRIRSERHLGPPAPHGAALSRAELWRTYRPCPARRVYKIACALARPIGCHVSRVCSSAFLVGRLASRRAPGPRVASGPPQCRSALRHAVPELKKGDAELRQHGAEGLHLSPRHACTAALKARRRADSRRHLPFSRTPQPGNRRHPSGMGRRCCAAKFEMPRSGHHLRMAEGRRAARRRSGSALAAFRRRNAAQLLAAHRRS